MLSEPGAEVSATPLTVGTPTALITVVAARARLPLPAASSTALAESDKVTVSPAAIVRVENSVIVTVLPERLTVAPAVWLPTPPTFKPNTLRLKALMSSLNVRITCVPSVDVVGASLPVVTSVGRMPSTFCPASIATAP